MVLTVLRINLMRKVYLFMLSGIGGIILGAAAGQRIWHPADSPFSEPDLQKIVALTFDDGPSARYTPQILDLLKENGVHATFFVIGRNIVKYPELVKREIDEGHAVGNHTWSHPFFTPFESKKQLFHEITRTDSAIYNAAGVHASLYRAPHGWCSPWMVKSVEGMGYDVVNWTVDPTDWKHPEANIIVKRVETSLGKSSIILLHDGLELKIDPGQENTVQALREIITDFKAKGYRFVTVTELLQEPKFAQKYHAIFNVISEPKRTS
jgi:peptidoglycan/xylan/chitin deacetylase (PgdA/CDA1 family)